MNDPIDRRGFVGAAAAAAAATGALPFLKGSGIAYAAAPARKVDSTINGVKLGIIAPYAFRGEASTAEEILSRMVTLGLSWVEMQNPPIERYAGAPQTQGGRGGAPGAPAGGSPGGGAPGGAPRLRPQPTPEQQAERARSAAALKAWRLSQSMDRFVELRRKYEDAGIQIPVVKFGLGPGMDDDETDYAFQVARAMGAYAITCEPPVSSMKRLSRFATKHRIMVAAHGHSAVTSVENFGRPGAWEQAFYYGPYIGANIDIGHFTAGNSDPKLTIDTVREFAPRMSSIHLKDRRIKDGPNVPWGQGDTPIREVLQMMRDEKMLFMANIELEYPTPAGSTVMAELGKCLQYARSALTEQSTR